MLQKLDGSGHSGVRTDGYAPQVDFVGLPSLVVELASRDALRRARPDPGVYSPAGLQAARARGRNGGRPFKMNTAKLRLAQAAMGQPETKIAELCAELGITRQTLYRHVHPKGALRPDGQKLLERGNARRSV